MNRWLARLLAGLVVACGLVPLTAGASWACSCSSPDRSETQQWRSIAATAPLIYVAEVTGRSGGEPVVSADGTLSSGGGEVSYRLRVVESLKGSASGTRTATTSEQGSSCGVVLDTRRRVLVHDERLGLCGGFTQERVPERAAIVRAALAGQPGTHVVVRGDWLWRIARAELTAQSVTAPSATAVERAARLLHRANRRVIGPDPDRLQVGTRLVVPRLV